MKALAFLLLAQAAPAPADPAVVLVRDFIAALGRDDGVAEALLGPDAMAAAGDMGGPVDAATLRQMNREFARHCRLRDVARAPRQLDMAGRQIVIVAASYRCVSAERPEGHDLELDYMAENGRIAGLYIPTDRPPPASPQGNPQ